MPPTDPGDPLPSPEELATAMREGLESRRLRPGPPPQSLPEPLPRPTLSTAGLHEILTRSGGLVGLPAPPARNLATRGVRLLRGFVKRLLHPWLDQQTQFNHAATGFLLATEQYLREGDRRAREDDTAFRAAVNQELARLRQIVQNLETRLGELYHELVRLRRSQGGRFTFADSNAPVEVIEEFFLQTRLPPPPARVLVLGPVEGEDFDLASLGYELTRFPTDTHAGDAGLPFAPATFQAAVALGPDIPWPELQRLLSSGSRVIGITSPTQPVEVPLPARLLERVHAVRTERGWELLREPAQRTERVLWLATI